jgi:PAS domain S-box-containing protein
MERTMNYAASEGLAQALFEESGDALLLFDPETEQILDVNSKAQRLTGFPLRDLLRMPMAELLRFGREGDLARVRDAASKTGTFHSQEGYFLRSVRPEVWIPINLTVARLHVKPQTLALLTARDLRERRDSDAELREARARLREAEAELHRVLASTPDCVWSAEVDDAGHVTYTSITPAVEAIAGQPDEFFAAGVQRWWGIIHPEDQRRWEAALLRWRAGQSTQADYRVLRPDGGCRWVRESVRVSERANSRRLLRLDCVIRDITEWKQAEAAGREAGDRLAAFLDGAPVLAFMKDPEGRLVYHNASFARLLGQGPAALLGKTDFDLFPAAVARRFRETDAAVLAAREALTILESLPAPQGALRRWLVFRFPVEDAAGRRQLGGMAVDVTALVQPGGPLAAESSDKHASG